jgi:CMP-N-acetylneuraminic acid synthetase
MKRKTITAIVPVRKGSQRVKNKNIRPFGGSNLLKIKLDVLTKIKLIDRIVVSSDCDICLNIAKDYGVDIHHREPYFASSEATNSEFFENLGTTIDGDYLLYTPVTAPLICEDTYYDFINRFISAKDECDSMVTTSQLKHHMWLDNKPLNYNPKNAPNSQDLPDIVRLTYGLNIIKKETMINCKNIVGDKPLFYMLDEVESVDIDTPLDFEFAEFIYKQSK